MKKECAVLILSLLFPAAGCSPFNFNLKSHNFGVVKKGKIYRSSQPNQEFLEYLIKKYRIRSIVSLRGKVKSFERRIADENGIKIYLMKMSARREPTEEQIKQFLAIVDDPNNQPVLVHCAAGADRTGVMIGILRLERCGWTLSRTIEELFYYHNIPGFLPMPQLFLYKNYSDNASLNEIFDPTSTF